MGLLQRLRTALTPRTTPPAALARGSRSSLHGDSAAMYTPIERVGLDVFAVLQAMSAYPHAATRFAAVLEELGHTQETWPRVAAGWMGRIRGVSEEAAAVDSMAVAELAALYGQLYTDAEHVIASELDNPAAAACGAGDAC